MSDTTINLTPLVYQYLLKNSLREPAVLTELREETHKLSMAAMQISPEQGQFMGMLIKLIGAKKALEVGTFTGYSALSVALSLPQDGKLVACDISTEWTNVGRRYWSRAGVDNKIDLRIGPALDTLQQLISKGESGTFDFVFIDADKSNYAAYYEKALTLLRHGGLIVIDNVLWSGKVADGAVKDKETNAIRDLNDMLVNDKRIDLSMLPVGDGITLVRKI